MATKTKCKDKCKKKTKKDVRDFGEDYKKNLRKLYDGIVVEACEKASEIDVATEEEFEKLKKLYSIRRIDDVKRDYDRKERNVTAQTGTYYSFVHNMKRMGEISNKINYIQSLKKEVGERVEKEMQDESHYKVILRLLITEGLYKLLEPNITIRCREKDKNILKTLLKTTEEEYNKETGQSLALKIDENNHLPKNVHGIHMIVKEGKILLENTLNSRIDQIFEKIIPTLNLFLFAGSDSKSRNMI